jgi:hypothetical protein
MALWTKDGVSGNWCGKGAGRGGADALVPLTGSLGALGGARSPITGGPAFRNIRLGIQDIKPHEQ